MDPLEEYLQGPYLEDKNEIRAIEELIGEIWPVFQRFRKNDNWPYEIQDKRPVEIRSSSSTNSMVLFTISQLLGPQRETALAPHGKRALAVPEKAGMPKRSELEATFRSGLQKLVKIANSKWTKSGEKYLFDSHSFGKNDPFTLTWNLELLSDAERLKANSAAGWEGLDDFRDRLIQSATSVIERAFEKPSQGFLDFSRDQGAVAIEHAFPLLKVAQLLKTLCQRKQLDGSIDALSTARRALATEVQAWFTGRVHYHLSMFQVTNGAADAAELVLALEGMIISSNLEGMIIRSKEPRSIDYGLLNRVFEVLADAQRSSAYWRPLRPFVTTPQGHALLPLSVEIANSLLRICQYQKFTGIRGGYFSGHLALFRTYVNWLRTRVVRGTAPMGNEKAKPFIGWHSEHVHVQGKIHPWETSQVLLFLIHYRDMLAEHTADTLLGKANLDCKWLSRKEEKYKDLQALKSHLKDFEPLATFISETNAANTDYDVFGQVLNRYLLPRGFAKKPVRTAEADCSLLLYGPPGTGKSTVAEEIAKALEWELITVTPSDFIARGEAEVEARAKAIFKTLEEQSHKVILLDEIDRLILDRDSAYYREQTDLFQFMTPSMLVKLRDLRRAGQSIFLIATNYEERIDAAAKRKGRIDRKLIFAPPDSGQRARILKSEIQKVIKAKIETGDRTLGVSSKERSNAKGREAAAKKAVEGFSKEPGFEEVVAQTALMVFGELSLLAADAAKLLDTKPNANASQLAKELAKVKKKQEGAAIRLALYEGRFKKPPEPWAGQEPFREFFTLLYIRCEAADTWGLLPAERKVIYQVFTSLCSDEFEIHKQQAETALMEHLKNAKMRDTIMGFFPFSV
jgi:cytidylate kinase